MRPKFQFIQLWTALLFFFIFFWARDVHTQRGLNIPTEYSEGVHYESGVAVAKLPEGLDESVLQEPGISALLQSWGLEWQKFFPQAEKPSKRFNDFGEPLVDLTRIIRFEWQHEESVKEMLLKLRTLTNWEYLQPLYFYEPIGEEKTTFIPSDPNISSQYYLGLIQAYEAWDITQGDTNVVVAIVDGGTNFGHADLQNYKYNYGDPLDGLDNDGNGYLDDCCGWSTGNNTNQTQYNFNGGSNHGVFVSGVASATTNNAIGIAGVGFACRYMPVKIVNPSGQWNGGIAGIFYAAFMGADVINCSWGSIYPDPLLEDVTRYAVFNKNCLLVAAAGNSNPSSHVPYYPAAYEWCMAVAGTTASDLKWGTFTSGSSYYDEVDISAPAHNILSTSVSGYATSSGTSFSTPMVSAAGALVKSVFPTYQARQIRALLIERSDDIYGLPGNAPYLHKLGKGRLNVFKAVQGPTSPSPEMIIRTISDGNDNLPHAGETVSLSGQFINWLLPSSPALTATLSTTSPHISIIDPTTIIGSLGTLGTFNSSADPFVFTVLPSCPPDHRALFIVQYTDGAYTHRQVFHLTVNPSYVDITINACHSTVASNGRIGFADEDLYFGKGLSKNGLRNALEACSFIVGNSSSRVSDATFGSSVVPFDQDFVPVQPALPVVPSVVSHYDVAGVFNDHGAGAAKLNVEVSYRAYAWNNPGDQNFIILDYVIKNTGSSHLANVYAGLFANWRILNGQAFTWDNVAAWDASRNLGYVYSSLNPQGGYAGIKFLGYTPPAYYAFNNDGAGGSINVYDGFTTAEKWQALSNGVSRPTSSPGTTSSLIGTGPFDIAAGAYARVSFALVVGDNLGQLQAAADAAQLRYESLFSQWTGSVNNDWNNPANWSPSGVPTAGQDVLIGSAPHQPHTSGPSQCRDLVVKTGQTLYVEPGAPLTVNRMLVNNGQVIVNHSPGLVQTSESILAGNGTWKVRRQLVNSGLSHHFVGSAVAPFSLSDVAADIGGFGLNSYATFDGINVQMATCSPPYYITPTSPYGNILQYNEAEVTTCHMEGWEVRTGGSGQSGRGYAVLAPSGTWLDVNGTIHNQEVVFSGVTRTATNSSLFQGINLVANPYPSSLDWLAFRASNLGAIQGSGYLYNQGSWVTLDAFTPGQRIAPLQGFEVEAWNIPGVYSITFRNNQRSAGMSSFFSEGEPYSGRLIITVMDPSSGRQQEAFVYITEAATWQWDPALDGKKFPNDAHWPDLWLRTRHDSLPYSVMAIPALTNSDTLWLWLSPPAGTSELVLQVEGLGFGTDLPAWAQLHDTSGAELAVFSSTSPSCTLSIFGAKMFYLTFHSGAGSVGASDAEQNLAWFIYPTVRFSNSVNNGFWKLFDATGRMVASANITGNQVWLPSGLASGVYVFSWLNSSTGTQNWMRILIP
ncbi:MAG: S8 family peptidase [Flavobacteriales bacterium]|nr:S8 family peptidase [Flavobacteriales bacterium]MCX7768351.1 S8 family peptidase [Flavobacteriales bacterium]MDW8409089.1 S8 family peptidase [Flavobacteriales bacterium]